METEVRRAEGALQLAYRSRIPDVSIGLEADAKAAPTIFSPTLGVTLPIWRDKIAAQIASQQAGKHAAKARLSAEQIMLAVEFAEKTFMFREATRNLQLLRDHLLPKAKQSLDVARTVIRLGNPLFLSFLMPSEHFCNFNWERSMPSFKESSLFRSCHLSSWAPTQLELLFEVTPAPKEPTTNEVQ